MDPTLYDRLDKDERRSKPLRLNAWEARAIKYALWSAGIDDQRSLEDAVLAGGNMVCRCGRGRAGATGLCDACFLGKDGGSIWRPRKEKQDNSKKDD